MAIIEVFTTVSHRSLLNKPKWALADWIMHLMRCRDDDEAARVRRVNDLLEASNRYLEEARAARAKLRDATAFKPTHRHLKRGGHYQVLGFGQLQSGEPIEEGAALVVYRDAKGRFWARPHDEFHDGRFEPLEAR